MKVFVAQYDCSMSPEGKVVAVSLTLEKVEALCQSYECALDHKPEDLKFLRLGHGRWEADGTSGVYRVHDWEVAP